MGKIRTWLDQNEILKLICEYFAIGAFVGILIALVGIVWLGIDHSDYVFPKLLGSNIIILWLSRIGLDVL